MRRQAHGTAELDDTGEGDLAQFDRLDPRAAFGGGRREPAAEQAGGTDRRADARGHSDEAAPAQGT
ncbi:hypothetical protein ACIQ8D_35230 [Streptomyces sp. NPDC096094]|uniref:hypothetical protein n=1 Tax=Streptomyces sp. NPDC096094 TaxID=3366073 RepID=UPI0037FDC872